MSTTTTTQSFDDRSNVFKYSGAWFLQGTWNASSVGQTGTLSSTNDQSATVAFTFPVAAVSFSYYGIKRSRGASYGICVDCDPNNPNYVSVDAFDANDNGQNPPVALYSQTFPLPAVHAIIIRNQADSRGTPAGNSQLTVDRIDLQVPVAGTPSTVTVIESESPTQSSSSTNAPNSITSNGAASLRSSSTGPSQSSGIISSLASGVTGSSHPVVASNKSSPPIGAIVGAILGALALLAILFICIYWLRLRHKRTRLVIPMHEPPPNTGGAHTATTTSSPAGWTAGYGYNSAFEKQNRHRQVRSSTSSPSTTTAPISLPSTVSYSQPQRAVDAGPIPTSSDPVDDNMTLPPEYGQVFRERSSPLQPTRPPKSS